MAKRTSVAGLRSRVPWSMPQSARAAALSSAATASVLDLPKGIQIVESRTLKMRASEIQTADASYTNTNEQTGSDGSSANRPAHLAPAHLAHDARNWLTVLRVHCDLLMQSGAVAKSHREWLQELSATIDRGQSLVASLLAATPSMPAATPTPVGNPTPAVRLTSTPWHSGTDRLLNPAAEIRRRIPLLRQMVGPAIQLQVVCNAPEQIPDSSARTNPRVVDRDPRSNDDFGLVALSELSFERILLNLVRNAIEAMPDGGRLRIEILSSDVLREAEPDAKTGTTRISHRRLRSASTAKRPASIRIRVEDSGKGVPAELAEHIFEAGFSTRRNPQSIATSSMPMGNTHDEKKDRTIAAKKVDRGNHGLGLAIAREIVATAGGTLCLEANPEPSLKSRTLGGACFVLDLPLVPTKISSNILPLMPPSGMPHSAITDSESTHSQSTASASSVRRTHSSDSRSAFDAQSLQYANDATTMLPPERNPRKMLNKISMTIDTPPAPVPNHPGMLHLLVVDDETPIRTAAAEIARNRGFAVHTADSTMAARAALAAHMADIVLLDLKLPGGGGLALLDEIRTLYPETVVIVMTAYATVASAVEAMRSGASEYLTKPFTLEELGDVLERGAERRHFDMESRRLREKLRTPEGFGTLIGRSPEMERMYRILAKVANTSHPVLILGESGTGKEMVARTIHYNGPNASQPFIPVDCGSLVPTLIESELFGYVKGAFTGANRSKDGLLATAEDGTVFLDEIGELPLDLQAKLLRALQEKEIRPVGSNQRIPIHARILAATNRDLPMMVEQGRFRKDLYFRLNVVNVKLPPLRDRRADIPILAAHFLDRMRRETNRNYTLNDDVLRVMNTYDWPGNVRELENMIERACALSSGPLLHLGDLPTQLQEHRMQTQRLTQATQEAATDMSAVDPGILTIAEMEKQAILNTIRQLNGDKLTAAKLLGIGKTTLYRKLKEYGIADVELQ